MMVISIVSSVPVVFVGVAIGVYIWKHRRIQKKREGKKLLEYKLLYVKYGFRITQVDCALCGIMRINYLDAVKKILCFSKQTSERIGFATFKVCIGLLKFKVLEL